MIRNSVVLPVPLGPIRAVLVPSGDLERHTVQQGAVGKEVVNTGNVYVGHANNLPTPTRRPPAAGSAGGCEELLEQGTGRGGAESAVLHKDCHGEVTVHGHDPGVRFGRVLVAELRGTGFGTDGRARNG